MSTVENTSYRGMAMAQVRRQKHRVLSELQEAAFWPETCWMWPGKRDEKNRPFVEILGRRYNVCRLVLQMNGHLPKGLEALHRCDNPACFRWLHLFAGTQAENMEDMKAKRRGRKSQKAVEQSDRLRPMAASQPRTERGKTD